MRLLKNLGKAELIKVLEEAKADYQHTIDNYSHELMYIKNQRTGLCRYLQKRGWEDSYEFVEIFINEGGYYADLPLYAYESKEIKELLAKRIELINKIINHLIFK